MIVYDPRPGEVLKTDENLVLGPGQFEVIDGPGLDPRTQHHQHQELIPDPSAQAAAILAEEAASITSVAEGLVFDSRPSQAQV